MNKQLESEVIRKFHELVERGDLADDIKIVYCVAGGMPVERVEEELKLSGSGKAEVMVRDMLKSMPTQEVSTELGRDESQYLFQEIGRGLDSLATRSEARFLPDSLVGSITIQVEGEETTLYFLADEEERISQNKPITSQMAEAIQHVTKISHKLLKKGKE